MAKCPICSTESNFQTRKSPYWVCPSCDMWFQSPVPPKQYQGSYDLDEAGNDTGRVMTNEAKRSNWQVAEVLWMRLGKTTGKSLDIGTCYPFLPFCLAFH